MTFLRCDGGRPALPSLRNLQEDASRLYAVYRMVLRLGGRYAAPL